MNTILKLNHLEMMQSLMTYWGQVAFYWKCTGKKPFLVLVNDKEYLIYDDTHAALYDDHLEYQYNHDGKKNL
jgi:DhnA family fructose-bisphosphate aldolase class Ia